MANIPYLSEALELILCHTHGSDIQGATELFPGCVLSLNLSIS